jgi:hypothetical protein
VISGTSCGESNRLSCFLVFILRLVIYPDIIIPLLLRALMPSSYQVESNFVFILSPQSTLHCAILHPTIAGTRHETNSDVNDRRVKSNEIVRKRIHFYFLTPIAS